MIPVRVLSEKLGYKLEWNNSKRIVELRRGPKTSSFQVGKNSYTVNFVAPIELSKAPVLKDSLTYVPLEYFQELLKDDVKISGDDILINAANVVVPPVAEINAKGTIVGVNEFEGRNSIKVSMTENTIHDVIVFNISEETKIVDMDGKEIKPSDLKLGNKIEVEVPEIMTMSLPPQANSKNIKLLNKVSVNTKGNKIKYPEVQGLDRQLAEGKVNKQFEIFIKDLEEKEIYKNADITYEIKYFDDEIISVLFYGEIDMDGMKRNVQIPFNLDLRTGNEVNYENFFKTDDKSKGKLEETLIKAAKDQYDIEFEAEGRSIFFEKDRVVVSYMPLDDSAEYPILLRLQLDSIKDLINIDL